MNAECQNCDWSGAIESTADSPTSLCEYLKNTIAAWKTLAEMNGTKIPDIGPGSMEAFVLLHGWEFPKIEPDCTSRRVRRGVIKECYRNAANLALGDSGRFTYCEGYAVGVIPVLHAWVIDRDGTVIDPTWPRVGSAYFGIPFRQSFLRRELLRTKTYGLLDRWEDDFRLIRTSPTIVRRNYLARIVGVN